MERLKVGRWLSSEDADTRNVGHMHFKRKSSKQQMKCLSLRDAPMRFDRIT